MSSQTIPSSFNPHAVHPFTSGAPPSQRHGTASIPIPSSHTTSPHRAPPRPSTTSIPSQVAQSHASQYPARPSQNYPSQQAAQPIFTPFRPERSSSPELRDVLSKKKSPSGWPAQPSYSSQSGAVKK